MQVKPNLQAIPHLASNINHIHDHHSIICFLFTIYFNIYLINSNYTYSVCDLDLFDYQPQWAFCYKFGLVDIEMYRNFHQSKFNFTIQGHSYKVSPQCYRLHVLRSKHLSYNIDNLFEIECPPVTMFVVKMEISVAGATIPNNV